MQYCYDGTTNRCCEKKKQVIKKIKQATESLHKSGDYCDISEIIKIYNDFLKTYVDDINHIIDKYNDIVEKISNHPVDVNIKDWISVVQEKFKQIGRIEKLKHYKFTPSTTILYVCDELDSIFKMIKDDIVSKQKIIRDLVPPNTIMLSPPELFFSL
jgi:uncharacterized membrane-anchored protein YjiN (DUF445 family)